MRQGEVFVLAVIIINVYVIACSFLNLLCSQILYRPLSFPASTVSRTGTGSSTGLTRSAEDLIRGLLQREPGRRLRFIESVGTTDASLANQQQFMLQRHSFYEQTDWERVVSGKFVVSI